MSELIKCGDCGGSKQVRGCGYMLLKCTRCNGIGWIEGKAVAKHVNDVKFKKRGRPAKVPL